jgi:hypothetical protein
LLNTKLLSGAQRSDVVTSELATYYRKKWGYYHGIAVNLRIFMSRHYGLEPPDVADMIIPISKADNQLNRLIVHNLNITDQGREDQVRRIFALLVLEDGEK